MDHAAVLLQLGLVLLSILYSCCVKGALDIHPSHTLAVWFAVSIVSTCASAIYITFFGSGWRRTFSAIGRRSAVTVLVVDLFTDLLNAVPLLLPAMTFTLHSVLQRSQTFFAILVSLCAGRHVSLRETAGACISAVGVMVFVAQEQRSEQTQTSLWLLALSITSVIASKLALEVSQQVEMQVVQQGAPKAAMVFLTNVLAVPVSAAGIILLNYDTRQDIGFSQGRLYALLALAACAHTAYLALKMHAHKRKVSALTHAFLSNVRGVCNVCLGKGSPAHWTVPVWFAVATVSAGAVIRG